MIGARRVRMRRALTDAQARELAARSHALVLARLTRKAQADIAAVSSPHRKR